ncbi:hypothetical protein [Nonomuraea guangzhouensis]|uniref:Uncharacterized protein n=1 Tax=Nonomuraea guangzhouensis TaxID=1291555 RepID=A0ABW4GZ00_9ACTN|nr:hypothetical protein [Nonomuraea guangzhouensis]
MIRQTSGEHAMLLQCRRVYLRARHPFAFIFLIITLSSCGWFHETLEVDPTAINDARQIGTVVLHAKSEYTWENSTQIDEILVMDVGASDSKEAEIEAHSRLIQQGWTELNAEQVESRKGRHVIVSLDSLDGLEAYGATLQAEIEKAVQAASKEADTLVIVDLAPME